MFEQLMPDRFKDVLRIAFVLSGIFVILSFITFSPGDISWLTTDLNSPIQNAIGSFGANLTFGMRFCFGSAVWLIPLFFLCWVYNVPEMETYGQLFKAFLGAAISLIVLAGLLSIVVQGKQSFLYSGGLIGPVISSVFIPSFDVAGTVLILMGLLVLSLFLASEMVLLSLIVHSVQWVWKKGLRFNDLLGARFQKTKDPKSKKKKSKKAKVKEEDEEEYEYEYEYVYEDVEEEDLEGDAEPAKVKIVTPQQANRKAPVKKAAPKIRSGVLQLPSVDLLEDAPEMDVDLESELQETSELLRKTLENFDIPVDVVQVNQGPVITVFEIQPAPGIKVSKIVNLADDLALALGAPSIRIVAPIPGKSVVGVEIPNKVAEHVFFKDLIESEDFHSSPSKLALCLGKDVAGYPLIAQLDTMPHLLIAGSTGSGKTVCMNALIMSVLYKATSDEVKLIMIDPKMVEMTFYNGIPHLITPVITNPQKASDALAWTVREMEKRYELFAQVGVRNISGYNKRLSSVAKPVYTDKNGDEQPLEKVPYIVVIIDELADLMMTSANDVETAICRLAQLSRAVGIHLVIATQRPSVDVLTGLIKANLPCRIGFRVSSSIDSRTILDSKGAEHLLGKGDMLFIPPGGSKTVRVQGCFLTDDEIRRVVDFWKAQAEPEFNEHIVKAPSEASSDLACDDELYEEAVKIVIELGQASASLLQRRMRIGYNRAARLIEAMEANGIVSEARGSKPREVLVDENGLEDDPDAYDEEDEEEYEEDGDEEYEYEDEEEDEEK